MLETLLIAIALLVGAWIVRAVMRTVANDGYGRNPPPRSHREEVAVSQHEMLRRLVP